MTSPLPDALTGGIACGKSAAGGMLAKAGWHVIDSDEIAHRLMKPGASNYNGIVEAFGRDILNADETINRRALGDLVFRDDAARARLNAIVHPGIRTAWQAESALAMADDEAGSARVVVLIPLLYELGLEGQFGRVIAIGCSRAVQMARMRGRGLDDAQIEQRLGSQWAIDRKLSAAQVAIWNDGSLAALQRQVELLAVD